jgi:ribosomal protein S27AE
MLTTKQESILYGTHQAWKYNASLVADWLGIIIAVGSFYYYSSHPQLHLQYLMVAGILFIVGFFIALRIKCPKCGSHWYWQALKTPLGDNGLGKLRSQKVCPTCGFSG